MAAARSAVKLRCWANLQSAGHVLCGIFDCTCGNQLPSVCLLPRNLCFVICVNGFLPPLLLLLLQVQLQLLGAAAAHLEKWKWMNWTCSWGDEEEEKVEGEETESAIVLVERGSDGFLPKHSQIGRTNLIISNVWQQAAVIEALIVLWTDAGSSSRSSSSSSWTWWVVRFAFKWDSRRKWRIF